MIMQLLMQIDIKRAVSCYQWWNGKQSSASHRTGNYDDNDNGSVYLFAGDWMVATHSIYAYVCTWMFIYD